MRQGVPNPHIRRALQGCALLVLSLLLAAPAHADDYNPLGAVYVDSMNGLNVKLGVAVNDAWEYDAERRYLGPPFTYADVELGTEGVKLTAGRGRQIGHGLDRWGLGYARFRTQDLLGLEAVISQMGMSIKLGYFVGLENTPNRWLLGVGFGF